MPKRNSIVFIPRYVNFLLRFPKTIRSNLFKFRADRVIMNILGVCPVEEIEVHVEWKLVFLPQLISGRIWRQNHRSADNMAIEERPHAHENDAGDYESQRCDQQTDEQREWILRAHVEGLSIETNGFGLTELI